MLLGIISDTHGHLNQTALNALQGVDTIIHAGDVGGPEIIAALAKIAPVKAVRGNTDGGPWAATLPMANLLAFNSHQFYVLHDLSFLDLEPSAADVQVVVSGHTHQPMIQTANGVLYFNPGSASQSRRGGSLSVGHIHITENGLGPEIINLDG